MKGGKIKGLVLNPKDNVGVALMDLESGTELDLKVTGQAVSVKLLDPITYQHKFSIKQIDSGSKIIKFGEVIGKATNDIKPGQHVHMHNMIGLRIGAARRKRS
ncbi:MAG: UxaA family hydrolase [Dehalococcoidia bacterium]|jgi:altronate dehydratase small subunit|nr:UxaA family hydrolase [Dehalococcoidia bacterium]